MKISFKIKGNSFHTNNNWEEIYASSPILQKMLRNFLKQKKSDTRCKIVSTQRHGEEPEIVYM